MCVPNAITYTYVTGLTFAKTLRKEGLLKTSDRCCLVNELSLHLTRLVSSITIYPCLKSVYNIFSLLIELC